MTKMTQHRLRSVCSALALFAVPLAAALPGGTAQAQTFTPAPSCAAALGSLTEQWRSIAFVEPGKPAQMIVTGQHGYTTTGGQFDFMRTQIRLGARDCEAGRDADALQHINTVRRILERDSGTPSSRLTLRN